MLKFNMQLVLEHSDLEILPCVYDDFNSSGLKYGYLILKLKDFWGVYDDLGALILPFQYSDIECLTDKLFAVRTGLKWICIDLTGQDVLYSKYDQIKYLGGEYLKVAENNKWGIFTDAGKQVCCLIYEDVKFIDIDCFAIKLHGKWGFMNFDGLEITEIKYDSIGDVYNRINCKKQFVAVYINGEQKYIDKFGNEFEYWYPDALLDGFYVDLHYNSAGLISSKGEYISIPLSGLFDYVYVCDELINVEGKDSFWSKTVSVNYERCGKDYYTKEKFYIFMPENSLPRLISTPDEYYKLIRWENFKSKMTLPFNYTTFKFIDAEEFESVSKMYLLVSSNNLWGLISCNNEIYPCKYKKICFVSNTALILYGEEYCFLGNIRGERLSGYYDSIEIKECYLSAMFGKQQHFLDFKGRFYNPYIKKTCNTFVRQLTDLLWEIKNNNTYGIADNEGSVLVECTYDSPFVWIPQLFFKTTKNNLYGIINIRNEVIVPFKYIAIDDFKEGFAAVQSADKKWGFIDISGKEVISCQYSRIITPFTCGIAKVRKYCNSYCSNYNNADKDIVIINKKGDNILKNNYIYIGDITSGIIKVQGENEKWGYIDNNGNEVIPLNWKQVSCFSEEKIKKYMRPYRLSPQLYEVHTDKSWSVIDAEGFNYLSCSYNSWPCDRYLQQFNEVIYYERVIKNTQTVNRKFNILNKYMLNYYGIPDMYINGMEEYLKPFTQPLTIIFNDSPKKHFGFLDINGNEIWPCVFTSLKRMSNKYIKVRNDSFYGILSSDGNEIAKCKYDYIDEFDGEYARVYKKGLVGLINTLGQEFIACKYHKISDLLYNEIRIVCYNNKYNLLDRYGNELLEWKYNYIYPFVNDLAVVVIENICPNESQERIKMPTNYPVNYLTRKTDKVICTYQYGVVDIKGNEILKCIYEDGTDNRYTIGGFEFYEKIKNYNRPSLFHTQRGCILRKNGKYGFFKVNV